MTVRAPAAGRVLALVARPGMRLMGLTPGSLHDASTVVTLYDPARLQVRADVRLDDVPQRAAGPAGADRDGGRARRAARRRGAAGRRRRPTSRRTRCRSRWPSTTPPPTLKPDMLVQVTFLAPPRAGDADAASRAAAAAGAAAAGRAAATAAAVWVADQAAGVARRRPVKLGPAAGELVEVVAGLTPPDKLIVGGREGCATASASASPARTQTLGDAAHGGAPARSRLTGRTSEDAGRRRSSHGTGRSPERDEGRTARATTTITPLQRRRASTSSAASSSR